MFNTKYLKEIRIKNHKSQKDVANILQVTRSSYAMWETNNNIIPLKRLIIFCEYFNVSIDYIFGFTKELNYKNNQAKINNDLLKERLKKIRKENKYTQQKISEFLKIDQPTWSIYENGKSLIGTPFLFMICNKFKVSADYILGKINEPIYFKK